MGAGGTGRHPASGAFEDAANWQGGAPPATDQDAVFAPGKYTVTLASGLMSSAP